MGKVREQPLVHMLQGFFLPSSTLENSRLAGAEGSQFREVRPRGSREKQGLEGGWGLWDKKVRHMGEERRGSEGGGK